MKDNYLLPWREEDNRLLGEGVSRTSNPKSRLYSVEVQLTHQRPMHTTVRATSASQAEQFTKNRHPNATTITVRGLIR